MPTAAQDVQHKLEALREKIRHHEYLYYVLDQPEISDAEFDQLMLRLKQLEAEHPDLVTPDSPTQRVGGKPREGFVKVPHSSPMLSLDNAYNEQELRDWERRVRELSGRREIEYVCELKLDGLSMAVRYAPDERDRGKSKLVLGLTRGDGTVGEVVTPNVKTIRSVPLSISAATLKKAGLPPEFEARGEVVMPLKAFERMNEERERQGPRNYMGPVINERALRSILDYIETGRREGQLLTGGRRAPGDGYFLEPTLVADVEPRARIFREEIFGPVLAVTRARDFDQALEMANDSEYGLTGAVYTRDREKLKKAAESFYVGNLYLNRKCTGALVGGHPFGGFNMSGTDSKAGGRDYLLLFMQAKVISEKIEDGG